MTTTVDVATLRADLEQLQRARWGGTNTVTYQGNGTSRSVTYKTDAQMAAALTDLSAKLAEAEGVLQPRSFQVFSSKGW